MLGRIKKFLKKIWRGKRAERRRGLTPSTPLNVPKAPLNWHTTHLAHPELRELYTQNTLVYG